MIESFPFISVRQASSRMRWRRGDRIAIAVTLGAVLVFAGGAVAQPTPTPKCVQPGTGNWDAAQPCSLPSVSNTPVAISCSQLNGFTNFQSNMRLRVNQQSGQSCTINTKVIPANVNNLIIYGVGDTRNPDDDIPITLRPASGSPNGFEIFGSNIAIRNINFASGFGHGILIKPEASNVVLENVQVDRSGNAGMLIGGDGLCARGTSVMNAPLGYNIAPDAGGTLEFRAATARNNGSDGFSIDHSGSGPTRARFLSCSAVGNDGDGFDLKGPQLDVLCSQSNENGSRGIETIGFPSTSSTLQVENTQVRRNTGDGIKAGDNNHRVTANILANTLDENGGSQILNGQFVNVFDTIGNGNTFVSGAGTVRCGYNMYKNNPPCPGTSVGVGTPGSIKATPKFSDSSRTKLEPGSAGVNQGIFPATPAATIGIPVVVAQRQDGIGTNRQTKSGYDIGAYFARAASTPTPTGQPTRTRTRTRTPTSTWTNTPKTPVPTQTPCTAPRTACTGDCDGDGVLSIDELVNGVAISLLQQPLDSCPAFDNNCSGMVSVDELVQAVNLILLGCDTMPGVVSGESYDATTAVVIGSALGNPGMTVGFTVDLLNSCTEIGAANVDLVYDGNVVSSLICELDPDLEGQGLNLMARALAPFATVEFYRLTLSQAHDTAGGMSGMHCPGASLGDGAFARCTAQISSSAPLGYYNWIDIGTTSVSDIFGRPFDAELRPGMLVVNGTALPDAEFVSQANVPTSMIAGQQYTVSITMRNTGGKVWTASPLSQQYSLGDANAGFSDTTIWGVPLNRVPLQSGEAVTLGAQKTFTFTVTAPSTPGTYQFIWQVVRDGGSTSWIGDTSTPVNVTVTCGFCGCG